MLYRQHKQLLLFIIYLLNLLITLSCSEQPKATYNCEIVHTHIQGVVFWLVYVSLFAPTPFNTPLYFFLPPVSLLIYWKPNSKVYPEASSIVQCSQLHNCIFIFLWWGTLNMLRACLLWHQAHRKHHTVSFTEWGMVGGEHHFDFCLSSKMFWSDLEGEPLEAGRKTLPVMSFSNQRSYISITKRYKKWF